MASSEQSSITVGEKMGGLDSPSSPDPPHASADPDHEVENSLSEELLRLVLKESEAAQLQAEEDGGAGGGEESWTSNNHGTDYSYSGWDDDDKVGVDVGAGEVDDVGDGRESDRDMGTGFVKNLFPVRPGAEDCLYYMKTGTCKYGSMCRFNHPVRRGTHVIMPRSELFNSPFLKESEAAQLQAEEDGGQGGGEESGTSNNHGTDYNYSGWDDDDKVGVGVGAGEADDVGDGRESDREIGTGFVSNLFPVRPGAEDCGYYMKTGTCKYGSMCKFNHPVRRRTHAARDWIKDKEEVVDKPGLIECKYYLRTGGCRYGKACKYSHPRTQEQPLNYPRTNPSVAPVMELNFLGLPIRPGEKDCPYYMRNGSCKYAANCRFNHPDPTASGEAGVGNLAGYGNGPSVSSKAPSHHVASWSASMMTLNETAPFAPAVYSPPIGGVVHHKAEWNIYQVPTYPPERSVLPPQPYMGKNPGNETAAYANSKQQMIMDEFPERPGQPECTFFMKTGDCKFKSNCKYHHPKNRIPSSSSVPLSDKGLPLRPDQNVCSYYSRYGICKFGPACRFNHPVDWTPSNLSAPFSNFDGQDGSRMSGTGSVGNVAIEQSL